MAIVVFVVRRDNVVYKGAVQVILVPRDLHNAIVHVCISLHTHNIAVVVGEVATLFSSVLKANADAPLDSWHVMLLVSISVQIIDTVGVVEKPVHQVNFVQMDNA